MFEKLFENEHFIAIDKPAGTLSVRSRLGEKDPRPCLAVELEKSLNIKIFPVHRLDLEVSGLILFAKTKEAHQKANYWFENKEIKKTYQALTSGDVPSSWRPGHEFQSELKLKRGKKRSYETPLGESAITILRWEKEVKWDGKAAQLWQLTPLTGKSHQLRVTLVKHGFPILGDKLYGSELPFRENEIALRAIQISFTQCTDSADFDLPAKIAAKGLVS